MPGLITKVETQSMIEMMKMKLVSENRLRIVWKTLLASWNYYNLKSTKDFQNLFYDDYLAILLFISQGGTPWLLEREC